MMRRISRIICLLLCVMMSCGMFAAAEELQIESMMQAIEDDGNTAVFDEAMGAIGTDELLPAELDVSQEEPQLEPIQEIPGPMGADEECTITANDTGAASNGSQIPIDAEHFPDPVFRDYLLKELDEDGDGYFSEKEIASIKKIYLYSEEVWDLTGVKLFTELESLYCCQSNLVSLDVSGMKKLKRVDCWNCLIDEDNLNVAGCSQLQALYIEGNKDLTTIDLSGCPELSCLHCQHTSIQALNLTGCRYLSLAVEKGEHTTDIIYDDFDGRFNQVKYDKYEYTNEDPYVRCLLFTQATDLKTDTSGGSEAATKTSLASAKVTVKAQVYTGDAIKPSPKVVLNKKTLTKGTDYTVSYSNNKKVGVATVTVKGKGQYTGSKKVTFKINPKATAISKLTAKKKGFTAKWKKVAGVTGYELQYSLKKTFAVKQKATVKGAEKLSKGVTGLKSGKKYYVRVRAYKKVGEKTYYSAWSDVKTVKTK